MTVTVQYMPDCPNWQTALANVREALRVTGATDDVRLVAVTTSEEAIAIGFRGSPTVLIDGRDAFAGESSGVGLSCRVFGTAEGLAVAPTVDQLVTALRA